MNTRSVNSAAGVILAALSQNRTAAGIALALESAGLLMSPEAAADLASVSTDAVGVAEQAVKELQREHEISAQLRARVAELESPAEADRAKAPWGRGEDGRPLLPMGAHWTDIPELVDQHLAGIQARVDQAQPGNWYVSPTAEAPDTVCTQYDGYTRTVGRFANALPADLELVLHAQSDLSWCLDMVAKLRARVAELETERHTTNDALADITVAERSADRLTALFAPTQALRLETGGAE